MQTDTPVTSFAPSPAPRAESSSRGRSAAFETRAIHVGSEPELNAEHGVVPPISLATTYRQQAVGVHQGYEYARSGNPTRAALERALASLESANDDVQCGSEDATGALAFASGSAATATVVSVLCGGGHGAHVVSVADVYGGTSRFLGAVAAPHQGVETTFIDMSLRGDGQDAENELVARITGALRPNTKLIWLESPTNPLLQVIPIKLATLVGRKAGVPVCVDNTFSSPYFVNPLALGATIVTHSSSKYIGGHSDAIGGVVATADTALLERLRFSQNAYGAVPSPFDCWLFLRSLKTLAVRARQHALNALKVAQWLATDAVAQGCVRPGEVYYPGLAPAVNVATARDDRAVAWSQMSERARKWCLSLGFLPPSSAPSASFPCGGMVSFRLQSAHRHSQTESGAADVFLSSLRVFALAESLGGVESLAELPLKMTHAGIAEEHRQALGVDAELVRLSVGIEDVDDLVGDLAQAFKTAASATLS